MEWTKFERLTVPDGLIGDTDEVWKNNRYEVQIRFGDKEKGIKGFVWLSFKDAINKDAIHDWREMQRIKNELCGDEREGFEIFPAESRLVDTSNQFHIFVLPEGEKIQAGYNDRGVVSGHNDFIKGKGGTKQRDFEFEPEDALSMEDMKKLKDEYVRSKQ